MKKNYQICVRVMFVLFAAIIPMVFYGQTTGNSGQAPEKKKGCKKAPSHKYWSVGMFGGATVFNGDLSDTKWLPNKYTIGYNYGLNVTRQFTRVIGLRAQFEHGEVKGRVDNKFVDTTFITQKFRAFPLETNLNLTVNFVNWAMGYKPARLFTVYGIFGGGYDFLIGHKTELLTNRTIANLSHYKGPDKNVLWWHTDGRHRVATPKLLAGLGFDLNLCKHWGVNFEYNYKYEFFDELDMTKGGSKQVVNDMYSAATLGVAYKFMYACNVKSMEKDFGLVKYETTPNVLEKRCDSIPVSIKVIFPPDYFIANAGMYFEPVLKYEGGEYTLKPILFKGESAKGDGIIIPRKEGGTYTYNAVIPFKPGMESCELNGVALIYCAKEQTYNKKEDITSKGEFYQMPPVFLAPGMIATSSYIVNDQTSLIAPHGYVKEVTINQKAYIYFPCDIYKLNLKFGLNKSTKAMDDLNKMYAFILAGNPLNKITLNGWASPEGEETHNVGLSSNRAKAGQEHMNQMFKTWAKSKDPNIKIRIAEPEKNVNYVITENGPDWNSFISNLQASNIKDKSKILNVINSAPTPVAKEKEIRNMILIYPEIEENLLPPLRRTEIVITSMEKKRTDAQILSLAKTNPDSLSAEEILYAGTLTENPADLLVIYDNAARIYPNNWNINNNAGVANIQKGNLDRAGVLLKKANELSPNNGIVLNNLGVLACRNNDYKTSETHFTTAQKLGEKVNYNLGTTLLKKCDYQKALGLFAGQKPTYNIALAQFMSGNNTAAASTLKTIPQNADTYYLAAVIAARGGDTATMYDNLVKAIREKPAFKEKIKADKEFYKYYKTPDFQNIVK